MAFLLPFLLVLVVGTVARPNSHQFSHSLQSDAQLAPPAQDGDTSSFEMIGACRATCVEQSLPMEYPPTSDGCGNDPSCSTCWNLCEQLFVDEMRYRRICDDCGSSIGCTSACKFSFTSVAMPETHPWYFEDTPLTTEVNDMVLHVSWGVARPRPQPKGTAPPLGRPFLVYTVLFRDDNNPHWILVTQTLDHITEVTGPHTKFPGLQFLLLVSNPSGTVARDIPPYPPVTSTLPTVSSTTATSTTTTTTEMVTPIPHQPAKKHLPISPDQDPASMSDVSVAVRVVDGRLEAVLTWSQEIHASHLQLYYTVQWGRRSCNVDWTMPHCPLTEENLVEGSIPAERKQEMRLILNRLTFNSEYWLEMGFEGFGEKYQTVFFTPGCPNVDGSFTMCITPEPVTPTPEHSTTTTSTASMTTTTTKSTGAPPTFISLQSEPKVEEMLQAWESLDDESSTELPVKMVLLSVSVSLCVILVVVAIYLIYKHRCHRPQPQVDLTKVFQSYTELPLLGIRRPAGSLASLAHLQCRNPLAQSIMLNQSYIQATPIDHYLTPSTMALSPPSVHSLILSPPSSPGHQDPTWTSVEDLDHPVACSTPDEDLVQPFPAPAPQPISPTPRQPRSRSLEVLNLNPSNHLRLPSMMKRSRSASRFSPARSPRPARRSVEFNKASTEDRSLTEDEMECDRVSSLQASIPPINHYLHTVPEDMALSDVEEDEMELSNLSDDLIASGCSNS